VSGGDRQVSTNFGSVAAHEGASRDGPGSRLGRYLRFCLVGGSGVVIDLGLFWILHGRLGWDLSVSKMAAATTAMASNFILNDRWTFRGCAGLGSDADRGSPSLGSPGSRWAKFLRFAAICGSGMLLAVGLLKGLASGLNVPVLAANLAAIAAVSLWNFGLNERWNWGRATVPGALQR